MTHTQQEIRDLVELYCLLPTQGCEAVGTAVSVLRQAIEQEVWIYIADRRTSHWAARYLGPVIAAGLAVGANLKTVSNQVGLWRICGFFPHRHLSVYEADLLLQKHTLPDIPPSLEQLEAVAKEAGRNPARIDPSSSRAELVHWLCRRTGSPFMELMAAECGRRLGLSTGRYRDAFEFRLNDLRRLNEAGELSHRAESYSHAHVQHDVMEIEQLLNGVLPNSELISMAEHDIAKQFLSDYYARAVTRKIKEEKVCLGVDSAADQV